jgi:ketosteroid isomerase-like protein
MIESFTRETDRAGRIALIEAFARAWEARDVDALMELMADRCEFHASVGPEPGTTFIGRDAVRRAYERFLAPPPADAVPVEVDMEPLLVCADFAVTRWTVRSPGATVPEVRACDVFEFEGDRIRVKDTFRKVPGAQ